MANETSRVTAVSGRVGIQRISWGAVFAAVAVTLAVHLFFSALGLSFGAGSVDPLTEQKPFEGLGIGAGIWFLVSSLLALFAGGWMAGHLSGAQRKMDGAIHGLLGWSVATLATFYLMTTVVGGVVKGTTGAIGSVLGAVGNVASPIGNALVKEGADLSPTEAQRTVTEWETAAKQAQTQLAETGKKVEQEARETGDKVAKGTSQAAAWAAVAMLLGALAAALGGFAGTPKEGVISVRRDDSYPLENAA